MSPHLKVTSGRGAERRQRRRPCRRGADTLTHPQPSCDHGRGCRASRAAAAAAAEPHQRRSHRRHHRKPSLPPLPISPFVGSVVCCVLSLLLRMRGRAEALCSICSTVGNADPARVRTRDANSFFSSPSSRIFAGKT